MLAGLVSITATFGVGLLTHPEQLGDWAQLLEGVSIVVIYAVLIVLPPTVIVIWIWGSTTVWVLLRAGGSRRQLPSWCALVGALSGGVLAPVSWGLAMSLWDPTLIPAGMVAGLSGGYVFGEVVRRGHGDETSASTGVSAAR